MVAVEICKRRPHLGEIELRQVARLVLVVVEIPKQGLDGRLASITGPTARRIVVFEIESDDVDAIGTGRIPIYGIIPDDTGEEIRPEIGRASCRERV